MFAAAQTAPGEGGLFDGPVSLVRCANGLLAILADGESSPCGESPEQTPTNHGVRLPPTVIADAGRGTG